MKTYKNLYPKLYSYKNLEEAFRKAKKGKISLEYVKEFEKGKSQNLLKLQKGLEEQTYKPEPLKKFIIHDPKTRTIRKSIFKDRIVHHAIVNLLEPIYEKVFIYDSYANRKDKGTHKAVLRFDKFKRKISKNGKLVKHAKTNNMIKGYVLKADIKHFFDSVNHSILLNILKRKIKDKKLLQLINLILKNFHDKEKGMPLGNMTSQFFANVYLNELDYFIKYKLKIKYYLRYVDDFVILYQNKNTLDEYKPIINLFLKKRLKLELHPTKSKIFSIYKGVDLLGYKVFYHYKLLRNRNIKHFKKRLLLFQQQYKKGLIDPEHIKTSLDGWLAYAIHANTYKLRKDLTKEINQIFQK